jgi:hypothetical protein
VDKIKLRPGYGWDVHDKRLDVRELLKMQDALEKLSWSLLSLMVSSCVWTVYSYGRAMGRWRT